MSLSTCACILEAGKPIQDSDSLQRSFLLRTWTFSMAKRQQQQKAAAFYLGSFLIQLALLKPELIFWREEKGSVLRQALKKGQSKEVPHK